MAPPPRPTRAALVIVDMQEDFCQPNGSLALDGGRELATTINELLDYPGFALKVATRDFHPADHISFASRHEGAVPRESQVIIKNPEDENETQLIRLWPDHCVIGTPGSELIPELHLEKIDAVCPKGGERDLESFSVFGPSFHKPKVSESRFDALLKEAGITDVFVVGLAYAHCVRATAIDAARWRYRCMVIEDVTNGVTQSDEVLEPIRKSLRANNVEVVRMDSVQVQQLKKVH